MSLTLLFHPLSSFCWKTLVALYENDTPFTPQMLNPGDEADRAALRKLWPIGKFPVLRDDSRHATVPESSIIIEYLAQHYPGSSRLVYADPDLARQTRLRDRFFDFFVHLPMQKIIGDRLRPEGQHDPYGVEEARRQIRAAYDMLEDAIRDGDMAGRTWAMGEEFTLADCAAGPALFYANMAEPFGQVHDRVKAYLERLMKRPSYARVLKEAEPYFAMIPK